MSSNFFVIVFLCLLVLLLILLVAMVIYGIIFIKNMIELIKKIDKAVSIFNEELPSIMKDTSKTMLQVSQIAQGTNNKIMLLKRIIGSTLGLSTIAFCGIKSMTSSLVNGFLTGFKIFSNKK